MKKSYLLIFLIFFSGLLSACSIQRAELAADAKKSMVGMSKEQILACMGVAEASKRVGGTEVWTYNSGNNHTDSSFWGGVVKSPSGTTGSVWGNSSSTSRFCRVNIIMHNDRVSKVDYSGPTGGLLTKGEQCAFAVSNCVNE